MAFEVDDAVLVTRKVLYKDGAGDPQVKNLSNESGTVKKADKGYYHVKTQYGVHYVKESDLQVDPG